MEALQPGRINDPSEINLNVRQVPDEISGTGVAVFEYFPMRGEAVPGPSYTYRVSPDLTKKLEKSNLTAFPFPEQNVTV